MSRTGRTAMRVGVVRVRTLLVGLGAAALAVPLLGSAAAAGPLEFDPAGAPTIGNFSSVTLNGEPQLASLAIEPFTLYDATETGAGWHVTLIIEDLVNGSSTIPAASMTMGAPVVLPVAGADMTDVEGHATTGNLATGEKIVTAEVGAGDGLGYTVSPLPVKVSVPGNALAGTYTGAASLALVSGP